MTESTTLPLGILPALPGHEAAAVTLDEGDIIVVATDGFYEWENNAGQQFGLDRLNTVITHNATERAAQLIRELYREVSAYADGVGQADDLTAVVIRRVGDDDLVRM